MKLKKALGIFALLTLFIVSNIVYVNKFMASGTGTELPTKYPLVYVYPDFVTGDVGDKFTISVIVYNLTNTLVHDPDWPQAMIPLGNLYSFDIQFSWNPTIIQYVNSTNPVPTINGYRHPNVTVPIEKYPNPIPPSPYAGTIHGFGEDNKTMITAKNVVNETGNIPQAGNPSVRAWFAYATTLPAAPFNGNGTIFVMTFKVLKAGESPLKIEEVTLGSNTGVAIGRTTGGNPDVPMHWLNEPRSGIFRSSHVPVASFTYWPDIGVIDKPLHLNASVVENASAIEKYMWDFGDGTKTNATTPLAEHSYNVSGVYDVSLSVMDELGVESGTVTKEVKIATYRDLKATSISLSHEEILPNSTLVIATRVDNLASASFSFYENCTVAVYYNASSLGATTTWVLVGTNQTSIAKGAGYNPTFRLNSSSLPSIETYYYFQVNVTGIPNGYEENLANNVKNSTSLLYTSIVKRQPEITTFNFGFRLVNVLYHPVINGENTTVIIGIRNSGNEIDSFNVTLYSNSSIVKTWNTGEMGAYTSKTIEWSHLFDVGYYNLTVEAKADTITAVKQGYLRVIKTPQLVIEYTPESPMINQEVTFNASSSTHQDLGGELTSYEWRIYAPDVDPILGSPLKTFTNVTAINYAFNQSGIWKVVLEVTDNYDLKYDSKRGASSAYRLVKTVTVSAPAGLPIEWVISIVVVVVVVVATAVLMLRRRRSAKRV